MAEDKKVDGGRKVFNTIHLVDTHKLLVDGEEQDKLELREPTPADLEELGTPVIIDWSQEPFKVSLDDRRMTLMLARLGGTTPGAIRRLHVRDWTTAAWSIAVFFVPRGQET